RGRDGTSPIVVVVVVIDVVAENCYSAIVAILAEPLAGFVRLARRIRRVESPDTPRGARGPVQVRRERVPIAIRKFATLGQGGFEIVVYNRHETAKILFV